MVSRAFAFLFPAALAAAAAWSQDYPAKPVRIVTGYSAGSGIDVIARVIAAKLGETWKQQVLVENRPGASANLAHELVARAAPDGHMLLIANNSIAINPSLYSKPGYALKDFSPVSLTGSSPLILVAHPSLPVKSIKELVAFAKARPGQINVASAGAGSLGQLAMELFQAMTKTKLVQVAYKGGPQALTDLVGGQVELYPSGLPPALPLIKSGRIKALAVTTIERTNAAPDVPTFAESGLADYEVTLWYGILAPAGTPGGIVSILSAEIVRQLKLNDVRDRFAGYGVDPTSSSAEQFTVTLRAEFEKWAKVIRAQDIRVD